ncbi:hypothetical protein F0562_030590 [Nyssa sinensis]|uniref:AAA+ ATPase domain-containing protein n=1 Tax=Nyssa sinensis TaxID=561372 RepID=A0A5J5B1C2_9ASTE|nr:hypothetical protein F0562_030590 [Nyssa sinensis]
MTQETILWLRRVNKAKNDIKELETRHVELELEAKKWLCGMCPFLVLLKLSKDIVAKTTEVADLQKQKPERILIESPPPRVEMKYPKNINNLPSLHEMVNQLREYLKSRDIKKIGIYGVPGVGKTTIMENLNDELKESDMFDIVICVTVEKDGNLSKIRDVIVERLKLNVEGINTDQGVATLISKALKKKKYLLLLDEVFAKINLSEVGVYDGHKHGKLVLASRSKHVCDSMDLNEHVHVEGLSKDDQWKMFRECVGDTIDRPSIKPIVKLILKECGGIPNLILAVARNLRNREDEESWRSELDRLRSDNEYQLEDMPEVFNVFKFAYDNLDDERKNCLLSGAFFPEEHEIYQDYLFECWKAMGFSGKVQTITGARNKGRNILNDLIDRETLIRSRGRMGHVKMPYIFWGVARRMVYGRVELLPEEMWKQKRISLISTDLDNFPDAASLGPHTTSISMLFLQSNNNLRIVPEFLFNGMSDLNLLDLSQTGIESLPASIGKLINLRGLYLNECSYLVRLPTEIKKLKNLEVLDICRTGFCSLPSEIGELTALRCLRISFTRALGDRNHVGTHDMEKIPSNLIEKLSFLEELTIDLDPCEPGWNGIADGIAREVANLRALTSLHFHFPGVLCLETFNRERKLWNNDNRKVSIFRFTIKVGSHPTCHPHGLDISGCSAQRHLRYSAGDSTPAAIGEVLKQSCVFELIGHQTVENLSDFGIDEMKGVEVCIIEECNKMRRILAGNITVQVFPFLKKLHIFRLQRLDCIWDGAMASGSLARLTTLTLNDCPSIEKILSLGMTQQLPELQHLKVENCKLLVKIIGANDQPVHSLSGSLPKLMTLELINLPILDSICESDSLEWPSLSKLGIMNCQNLQNLSLKKENAEHLRSIECNQDWWRRLVFQDIQLKQDLQKHCRFI